VHFLTKKRKKKAHKRRQKGNKTRTKRQAKDKDELAVSQLGHSVTMNQATV